MCINSYRINNFTRMTEITIKFYIFTTPQMWKEFFLVKYSFILKCLQIQTHSEAIELDFLISKIELGAWTAVKLKLIRLLWYVNVLR